MLGFFFSISDFCPKLEVQEVAQERQFWRFLAYFGALEIQIVCELLDVYLN